MKKFKRLLSLGIVLVCALGCFSACAKDKKEEEVDLTIGAKYKEMNAIEFTEIMGNGINLGNTMEAYGHAAFGTQAATTVYETAWGQPVTTEAMIQGMKAAGFDSVRIPVAWTNMMNYESGDYTINEAYINRVGEIIQWCINADMVAVVNDHWDGGWWAMFGSENEEVRKIAMDLYTSMWTQLAEAYKDFDYHLVLESANEEMGNRFNDEWKKEAGVLSMDECYALTNELNQKFVDIVRESGSFNKDRFLLCAGYNTDIDHTIDERYKMPTDTVEGKLIVSVHYYTPSAYCIDSGIANWGTKSDVKTMNDFLAKMTKFTDAGYGVIIGEYGVLIEGKSELKENTIEYLTNFLANCDYYGYCPMLWDCNSLYNRNECRIQYVEVADLYLKNGYNTTETLPEYIKPQAERTMAKMLDNATEGTVIPDDQAMAWIMFNSGDWSIAYRVGDTYPDGQAAGLVATDVEVTGAGTYTVALDFTGTESGYSSGIAFSALGILHGEDLFPGYYINITDIKINGESYALDGKPYTTSDDGSCTRVNIYNAWVNELPKEARVQDGDLTGCSPCPVDGTTVGNIQTLEITFEFVAP